MSDLDRVVKLATLLKEQQETVAELESKLKLAKADAFRTEREDLPELMLECGLRSFVLEDGSSVSIREEVDAAITATTKDRAMSWLEENNFGGLIKTSVEVQFDRGSHDDALALAQSMTDAYGACILKESVHPATLKSFVKEQLSEGQNVPMDVFNVRPYNIAKITPPKGSKK